MDLQLNGFWLNIDATRLVVRADRLDPEARLGEVAQRVGDDWFLYRSKSAVYGIPRTAAAKEFGRRHEVTDDGDLFLPLLKARIRDVLPDLLPQYEPHSRRPFSILARTVDFLTEAEQELKLSHPLLRQFSIRPRIVLDPRIVEIGETGPRVCLLMEIRTSWTIKADLRDLEQAGIDLAGLALIWRQPEANRRRLVGRVETLTGDEVVLAESFDGRERVAAQEVQLEGNFESFARCLRRLAGASYERLQSACRREEGAYTAGKALDRHLDTMAKALRETSPWRLAEGVSCSLGERIQIRNTSGHQAIVKSDPDEYCYDAAKAQRSKLAWPGLEQYGPYGAAPSRTSPRILVVAPSAAQGRVEQFCRQFEDGVTRAKPPRFSKGFAGTFGLATPRFEFCLVHEVSARTSDPGRRYGETIRRHVEAKGADYAAALVILLDEHAKLPDPESPYLISKAALLMAGIPVQEARLSTITSRPYSLQYTMQNLSVALYAKMGGVPWTVDHDLAVNDEIVIGIGTCELSGSRFRARERHVGITTVFRGDGNYLLSSLSKECSYDEYPETLRTSTLQILQEMRTRNGWKDGDTVRLVFHAHRPLRGIHVTRIIADCVAESGAGLNVQFAFLTVSKQHPFRLLDKDYRGSKTSKGKEKAVFVPERGILVELDVRSRLLCTNGPSLIKRLDLPLPAPLLIRLHQESSYSDLTYLSEQVLKFTSLSWRSVLPAASPVTIYYSELIARLLARFKNLPTWSSDPLVRLRASRWFL